MLSSCDDQLTTDKPLRFFADFPRDGLLGTMLVVSSLLEMIRANFGVREKHDIGIERENRIHWRRTDGDRARDRVD